MVVKSVAKIAMILVIGVLLPLIYGIDLYKESKELINSEDSDFEVFGVDVSSYQGEVNWDTIYSQGIDFAYIKATEGSGHVDPLFKYNFEQASEAGLAVGAYHFLSFETTGKEQAENFIATVPKVEGMLPPVVDVELYGDYVDNPPSAEEVHNILDEFIVEIESYYGVEPIIYVNEKSYRMYIKGYYDDYKLWISNYSVNPKLFGHRDWTFWQYSETGILKGYSGSQAYIDLNVYHGTQEEFYAEFQQ